MQKGDYEVTPRLNIYHLNGVSTLDLVLITKHILGTQPITSPYKQIAADANKSSSISTADVVALRKMILGLVDTFQNNTSWRFVDKDFKFQTATPLKEDFKEKKSFVALDSTAKANFIGVKIGDINGNAIPSITGQSESREMNGVLILNTDNQLFRSGETIKVTLNAVEMEQMEGFQFTLNYDKNVLELLDITEGKAFCAAIENGTITASWNDKNNAQNALYTFYFKAKKAARLSDLLKITSRVTNAEAYNKNGDYLDVELQFIEKEQIATTPAFELYQNTPNPFKGKTTISFQLPERSATKLTIFDAVGRIVKIIDGDYEKGYHEIILECPKSGIFHYRLDTPFHSATKKMIVVE